MIKYLIWACLALIISLPSHAQTPTTPPSVQTNDVQLVFRVGARDAWDGGSVGGKAIVEVDGVYHLFYDGQPIPDDNIRAISSIGHATSTDGIHWERDALNPLLQTEDVPYAMFEVDGGSVIYADDQWHLFFSTVDSPEFEGSAIGVATTDDLTATWQVLPNPLLLPDAEWDAGLVFQNSVVALPDESGYRLYYTGFAANSRSGTIATATAPTLTSPTWTKEGVITWDERPRSAWDGGEVIQPAVFRHGDWWIMIYMGLPRSYDYSSLGYAVSTDGIHWTRPTTEPLISSALMADVMFINRPLVLVTADEVVLYFSVIHRPNIKSPAIYRTTLTIN